MDASDGAHPLRQPVVDAFHRAYYDDAGTRGGTWHDTRWLGHRVWKTPLDLWQVSELLYELRPSLIIETGTAFGGSALFMASVCDALGGGSVVSIDIAPQTDLPEHQRIRYLTGSSTDPTIIATVHALAEQAATTLVILDSDHTRDHVLAECRAYADLVSVGSYLVVEDTNVNGHPVLPSHGAGPWEAVAEFLAERDDFEVDTRRHKFLMTFNPGGWLRRTTSGDA